MHTSTKHILIADDHGVVRYGMMLLIRDILPGAKVSQVGSFNEAVEFIKASKIDLVILDINLPGGNNIQMLETLNAIQKDIRILMFSAYEEKLYAIRYLQAGAKGYLYKQSSNAEIKKAIQTVCSGGVYMSDDVKNIMLNKMLNQDDDQNPLDLLSNREFEVAQMLIQGYGITDISSLLDLKMSTVSTYKNRIFEKLNVTNIVQLIDKFRFWKITDTN